jgi:putative ABC transport system substrate-binding protein
MKKHIVFAFYFLLFPLACFAAESLHIYVLAPSDNKEYHQVIDKLDKKLKEDGITTKVDFINIQTKTVKDIVAGVDKSVKNMLFVFGSDILKTAQENAPADMPIIFTGVMDFTGLQPHNVTGIVWELPSDLQVKTIRRLLPNIESLGLLYSPKSTLYADAIAQTCSSLKLPLKKRSITIAEFSDAAAKMFSETNCFLMLFDGSIYNLQTVKLVLMQSMTSKVPVVGISRYITKAGALFSLEIDYDDIGLQAADIIKQVFNGQVPGNLKVQKPNKIKYSLNLVTAEKLGISFSNDVISNASEVFK